MPKKRSISDELVAKITSAPDSVTTTQLAKDLGLSQPTVARYRKGTKRMNQKQVAQTLKSEITSLPFSISADGKHVTISFPQKSLFTHLFNQS